MEPCPSPGPGIRLLPPSPRVSRLVSEKRELEAQLGRLREEAVTGRAARQEVESLRGLVSGLELELRQERGLGHRGSGRRSQDCRRLAKEVRGRGGRRGPDFGFSLDLHAPLLSLQLEEVKASERSLRARLKALNTELALYKRG